MLMNQPGSIVSRSACQLSMHRCGNLNMTSKPIHSTRPLTRISMSLPEELLEELDKLVGKRTFPSRSHAISIMLSDYLVRAEHDNSDEVMFGTITLFYYNNVFDLPRQLAETQYQYIDEVISSLHVQLIHNQTMEVILVQGPAGKLHAIAAELTKMRGVIYSKLQLVGSIIPPLHPLSSNEGPERAPGPPLL